MKEIVLVLVDIRSLYNVGSIIRSANGFGLKTVVSVGITPYLKQVEDARLPHVIEKTERSISKTSLGAEEYIHNPYYTTVEEAINSLRKKYQLVALEQSGNSIALNDFLPPKKTALFLGNEVEGLTSEVLGQMDQVIEIPMKGQKSSFNVSVAAAVAIHKISE